MPALSEEMIKIKPMIDQIMQKNDGWTVLKKILEENDDPARPIGMFLAQFIMQLGQMLMEQDADVDPKVMLEEGGVVEYILNTLEAHFDLPKEFSDEIFLDVVEIIKASAQNPGQQQAQAGPPPQGGGGLVAQAPMGGM